MEAPTTGPASTIPRNQRPATVRPPLDTPTLEPGGAFTITSSIAISAPLETVLRALLDTSTYPTWNRFCPVVTIDDQPDPLPPLPDCCLVGERGKKEGDNGEGDETSSIAGRRTTLHLGTAFTFTVNLGEGGRQTSTSLRVSVLEPFERESATTSSSDGVKAGSGRQRRRRRRRRGVRLAWTTNGWSAFLVRCERVMEVVESDEGEGEGVEFVNWETFHGVAAEAVDKFASEQVKWGFGVWMDGLKEHAEKQAAASKSSEQASAITRSV